MKRPTPTRVGLLFLVVCAAIRTLQHNPNLLDMTFWPHFVFLFREKTLLCLFLLAGHSIFGQSVITAETLDIVANQPSEIVLPFQPDANNSGDVGIPDLLPFLIYFGNDLDSLDDSNVANPLELRQLISGLASALLAQQEEIEALQFQVQQQNDAYGILAPLLLLTPLVQRLQWDAGTSTVTLTGMNLQLQNGQGTTYESPNGLGNLILGYHEEAGGHRTLEGDFMDGEVRTGSHNLVLGSGHTFTNSGGILGGYNNTMHGQGSSILAGQNNFTTGQWGSILGGLDNRATGTLSCISGGHSNIAAGDRASVSGGLLNLSDGIATSILGGQYVQIFGQYETASGPYDIND